MDNKTVKKIKQIVRVNYNDLIRKLYEENFITRVKFAVRLLVNKKPFKFIWK